MNTTAKTVLLRCRSAAELIHTGRYEAACEELGDLWNGIGERPNLQGLGVLEAAELLLRCGVLSCFLGTTHSVPEAQERAKDLLTEALRKFQSQGQHSKASEVQYELSLCYFREGAYDDARVILKQALGDLPDELTARIHIRRTMVEIWTGRYHDAWDILKEAQAFFESCNDALKGKWHGQLALVLRRLATAEERPDYADRAIIEFTAAIYHYEQANHQRYCAINLNNLSMLLYRVGRYEEAYENLNRASEILKGLSDEGLLAQVNETKARVLIAEKRYEEADAIISEAIKVLEKGDEHALLSDALMFQGVIQARSRQYDSSITTLNRALKLAVDSGATSNAAHIALSLIEEHSERLSENDVYKLYMNADRFLEKTQDAEDLLRLRECSKLVARKLLGPQLSDSNFYLPTVVRAYEARFIIEALELAGGAVSRAGKMLGFSHHFSLVNLLNRKHKDLKKKRNPPTPRRTAIKPKPKPKPTILYVGERSILRGWSVFKCDEITARGMIATEEYSLFIFESLELARYARLYHKRTPIIIISTSDMEGEAWKIGIQGFVQDTNKLPVMVKRLLK
jgi:tetratricopeptide (TPR) repeat protein